MQSSADLGKAALKAILRPFSSLLDTTVLERTGSTMSLEIHFAYTQISVY